MDQYGAAIIQKFREARHGLKETFVYVALGIFSIRHRKPDPLHACISGQVPVAFGPFAFFEQRDNVCTSQLIYGWEIFVPRTME